MNDKILASVAGIPVTESEVTGMVAELAARGQNYDNAQGRAVILEQLISNKLLLADARKNLYEHSRRQERILSSSTRNSRHSLKR